jgi:hypothetical protein
MVLGYPVPEREGYRYVRLPGYKRTYAVKTDADPSARFEDWVEPDLLRIAASAIRRIVVNNYSIKEDFGRVAGQERIVLTRDGSQWKVEDGGTVNRAAVESLVTALTALRVVAVRPKPAPLAAQLKSQQPLEMTLETVLSLRQRGYFITPEGRLLAKEGEVIVETNAVVYTLRFGEVVTGASAEQQPPEQKTQRPAAENRYLFVTARPRRDDGAPANAEMLARNLEARFADWYYVISGSDFGRLRPRRSELVRN